MIDIAKFTLNSSCLTGEFFTYAISVAINFAMKRTNTSDQIGKEKQHGYDQGQDYEFEVHHIIVGQVRLL